MRNHLPEIEAYVTVVTSDRRGTGNSYTVLDPTDTLSLESSVEDTVAVTDYLRDRFDQDRIILAGQSGARSWGALVVRQHPDLYRAVVGVGQMVDPLETDRSSPTSSSTTWSTPCCHARRRRDHPAPCTGDSVFVDLARAPRRTPVFVRPLCWIW